MSHLVRAAVEEHGMIPLCPVHDVPANVRGQHDPWRWGHIFEDENDAYWCVHQVIAGGGDGGENTDNQAADRAQPPPAG